MRRAAFAAISLVAFTTIACGSSPNGDGNVTTDSGSVGDGAGDSDAVASDADDAAPAHTYPSPHPPFPQLVNQAGNSVLTAPKVYLIFYPGYSYEAQLKTMAQNLGASTYWPAAVGEYGVGNIAYVDSKELTGMTAPTTIDDKGVEAFINDQLTKGNFGTPDPQTIYTIFYPSTTTISQSGGGFGGTSKSCTQFGGYHSDTSVTAGGKTQNIPFAVLPTCASFGALSGIDAVTGALSHEWAEASTDPYPSTNRGADSTYSGVDNDHIVWNLLGGAENGDLCAQREDAFFKPKGFDYVVQATWSNAAAKKGGDPCAPKGTGVYFNAAPVLSDHVSLDLSALGGGTVRTLGAKIAKGSSKTIEVDLFSDADTKGDFTVTAIDALAKYTGSAPTLDFKWDKTTGKDGDKLHLTITVTSSSLFGGAHPFVLVSLLGTQQQLWPALVTE